VTPITALQSPDDSDIKVNVYTYTKDLCVNQFTEAGFPDDRGLVTESKEINFDETPCFSLNESTATYDRICEDYFGEQPLSFRTCLKRFVYTRAALTVANANAVCTTTVKNVIVPSIFPEYGSTSTSDIWGYLRYAYIGLRGGIRKRITYYVDMTPSSVDAFVATMDTISGTLPVQTISTSTTPPRQRAIGAITQFSHTNGGLEFECPMMTSNLFVFSFANNLIGSNNSDEMEAAWTKSYTTEMVAKGPITAGTMQECTAAGEDFSFIGYQGAPFFKAA
jgi:hypothetical protein